MENVYLEGTFSSEQDGYEKRCGIRDRNGPSQTIEKHSQVFKDLRKTVITLR